MEGCIFLRITFHLILNQCFLIVFTKRDASCFRVKTVISGMGRAVVWASLQHFQRAFLTHWLLYIDQNQNQQEKKKKNSFKREFVHTLICLRRRWWESDKLFLAYIGVFEKISVSDSGKQRSSHNCHELPLLLTWPGKDTPLDSGPLVVSDDTWLAGRATLPSPRGVSPLNGLSSHHELRCQCLVVTMQATSEGGKVPCGGGEKHQGEAAGGGGGKNQMLGLGNWLYNYVKKNK